MENNKKTKKKKNKKLRRILLFLFIIVVAVILVVFALNTSKNNNEESNKKVVDEIKKFSYTVSETDTKLFKDKFKELKEELSKKKVDNEKYAKLISELFVIDFYTLDNKVTKNDVGGVQFIYESYKSDFVDYARDGIYKQVISNIYNERTEKLPEVSKVSVESINEIDASSVLETKLDSSDAYEVKMTWEYKNNDDFQTEATIIVVTDGDKLSVAKLD